MQTLPAGVEHKDVIVAVFGGSIGIAGLLLIFQGFILSARQGLPAVTPQSVKVWFKRTIIGSLAALALAVISTLVSLLWLLNQSLYEGAIALFAASTISVFVLALVVTLKLI